MVQKMTWEQLMTKVMPSRLTSAYSDLSSLVNNVKTLQQTLIGSSVIGDIMYEVGVVLCRNFSVQSPWKNLSIWTSSFKSEDCRYVALLLQKATEYAGFYKKILTDEGVQRALLYSKTYNNKGNTSSTERGYSSQTPQNSNLYPSGQTPEDTLFDQAIANYASALDKNKASSESSSSGGSKTNVTGVTWDEAKKNMQLMFYSELCQYLATIPEKIYAYYSLDTMPAPELFKQMRNYLKDSMDLVINE